MATQRKATIEDLRRAINCLPTRTKIAMLDGIRSEPIIVGAYSKDGGICPMLAAHRRGGRTDCISFAKAWDAFAFRGARKRIARRATRRELLVLSSHLEASLLEAEGASPELSAAIVEHRDLSARRAQASAQSAQASAQSAQASAQSAQASAQSAQASAQTASAKTAMASDRHTAGARPARPGDPDRATELRTRPGWAWLRVFRRYDDYQRALELLDAASATPARDAELERVG
jgi:hypothetical protein